MHLGYLHHESKVTSFKLHIKSMFTVENKSPRFTPDLSLLTPPSSSCLYSCVCKPGYEGDGVSCSKVDPCAALNPGGCSINVSMCFSHRA